MPNAAGRFNGPWRPGADPYNAPPGSLLRADNMVRDEDGILSLRLGSRLLNQSQVPGTEWVDVTDSYRIANIGENDYSVGLFAWDNPGGVTKTVLSGLPPATSTPTSSSTCRLLARNFGLTIPSAAVVKGVEVNLQIVSPGVGGTISHQVYLVNGTTDIGSKVFTLDGTEDKTLGDSTDLWRTSILPSDLNDPDFGVAIVSTPAVSAGQIEIRAVMVRISYSYIADISAGAVTTLHAVVLNNVERIAHAAGEQLFIDGTVIDGATLDGDSTAFGSNRGHLLMVSGENRYKYDGTTLRNWGIEAPKDAPTVTVVDVSSKIVANFTQASAEFSASEGTLSYVTGYEGTANAATGLLPAVGTGRGIMSYAFATAQNLLDIQGNRGGDFDMFSFWVDDPQSEKFTYLDIDIGISSGSDPFLSDYYHYRFGSILEPVQAELTQAEVQRSAESTEAAQPEPPSEPPSPEEEPTRGGGPDDRVPTDERRDRRRRENP